MKKSSSRKPASAAGKAARSRSARPPRVAKEPQSQQIAATQGGMFLHTDDAWSRAYFDANDLHFLERELFAKTR